MYFVDADVEAGVLSVAVLGSSLPVGRWRMEPSGADLQVAVSAADGRRTRVALDAAGGFVVPPDSTGLAYEYSLRPGGGDLRRGAGGPGGWVAMSTSYLLRPDAPPAGMRVGLETSDALLPWTFQEQVDLPGAALAQPRFHAFGGRRRRVEAGGATLEVAVLAREGELAAHDDDLSEWVGQAMREVLTVAPSLPPRLTIALVPYPDFSGASPFGMQSWGTVAVLTGTRAERDDFRRDWVLVHELMHLVHPPFEATWLTEGFATYLAILGRLRSERLAEEGAWWEVLDGATDGRRRAGDAGLLELDRALHVVHAYRSVYWGGAVFALDLDLTIRKATGGTRSLESLMDALRGQGVVSLDRLQQATDALTGARTFDAVLARHTEGPALSSASGLLGRLGVVWGAGERVALVDDAPDASLRAALKRGRLP